MLILHLSDIHFKSADAGSAMDVDHHLRNMLVRDAKKQCAELGAVPDAILVSGDIAYAGDTAEYDFAQEWLEMLCKACGCEDTRNVVVIPGNHDVQQDVTRRITVEAIHKDIKSTKDLRQLPDVLKKRLTDEDASKLLYASQSNYNDFAAQYFCNLQPPHRTTVVRRFPLNDGSELCITGINSAFVSSHTDDVGTLYVDPSVFKITHEDGVAHLVMCHHPYNWLANGREVEDHLNDVSQIQLFGHEHTNRVIPSRDWMRISAGAVHPERNKDGWEPGYNLLELSIESDGTNRHLSVKAHIRVWQNRPGKFVPKNDRLEAFFAQKIELPAWAVQVVENDITEEEASAGADVTDMTLEEDVAMTSLRALSLRFFALTYSQKFAIAGDLDLLEEEDRKMPDRERFRNVLLRARERSLLDQFETAIVRIENGQT